MKWLAVGRHPEEVARQRWNEEITEGGQDSDTSP
jgi:hypothetical protein